LKNQKLYELEKLKGLLFINYKTMENNNLDKFIKDNKLKPENIA